MASIRLQDIRKSYGDVGVLHGIDLEVADGEFLVLVGPSGCGKARCCGALPGSRASRLVS